MDIKIKSHSTTVYARLRFKNFIKSSNHNLVFPTQEESPSNKSIIRIDNTFGNFYGVPIHCKVECYL